MLTRHAGGAPLRLPFRRVALSQRGGQMAGQQHGSSAGMASAPFGSASSTPHTSVAAAVAIKVEGGSVSRAAARATPAT